MANRIVSVHAGIYGMGIYAIMLPSSGFSVAHCGKYHSFSLADGAIILHMIILREIACMWTWTIFIARVERFLPLAINCMHVHTDDFYSQSQEIFISCEKLHTCGHE